MNKHVYYGGEKDLREALVVLEETIEERIIHQDEIKEMGNIILRLPQKQRELLYFKLSVENNEIYEVKVGGKALNLSRIEVEL